MVDPRLKKIARDWWAMENAIHAAIGQLPKKFLSEIDDILKTGKPATPEKITALFQSMQNVFPEIFDPNAGREEHSTEPWKKLNPAQNLQRNAHIIALLMATRGIGPSTQARLAEAFNINPDIVHRAWGKHPRGGQMKLEKAFLKRMKKKGFSAFRYRFFTAIPSNNKVKKDSPS